MAFTEFYARSGGSNLNAGSEDQDAASFTYAGGTFVRSTGVFTVASGDPAADGVAAGDFASIYTTSGATVATFVARVTARDSTTITVSVTAISGATSAVSESAGAATCKIGGAWSGPADAVIFPFGFIAETCTNAADDPVRVNFKGTFTVSAACASTAVGPICWSGYSTTAGDSGYATFSGGGNNIAVINVSGADNLMCNFIAGNGSSTASNNNAIGNFGSRSWCHNCIAHNHGGYGITASRCLFCEVFNCSPGKPMFSGTVCIYCHAHDPMGTTDTKGFDGAYLAYGCIADLTRTSHASARGFNLAAETAQMGLAVNCDAYNCTTGFYSQTSGRMVGCVNCNAVNGTTAYGYAAGAGMLLLNCGNQNNARYAVAAPAWGLDIGDPSYAASPYTGVSSGDWKLEAIARGAGFGAIPALLGATGSLGKALTIKPDIGALALCGTLPDVEDVVDAIKYGALGTEFEGIYPTIAQIAAGMWSDTTSPDRTVTA